MRAVALALLLVAALVAGCGGDGDGADAEETVSTAISGLAAGDEKKVCDQLTVAAQRKILVFLADNPLGFPNIKATGCREAIDKLHAAFTPQQRNVLVDGEVGDAKLNGDRAKVRVIGAGMTADLQKIDGKWMIVGGLFQ